MALSLTFVNNCIISPIAGAIGLTTPVAASIKSMSGNVLMLPIGIKTEYIVESPGIPQTITFLAQKWPQQQMRIEPAS